MLLLRFNSRGRAGSEDFCLGTNEYLPCTKRSMPGMIDTGGQLLSCPTGMCYLYRLHKEGVRRPKKSF